MVDTRRRIFVFGSNLAGRHGKGAAKAAREQYGAVYGQGEGLQGDSYAIPTKDANIKSLPIDAIRPYVQTFLAFAEEHPEWDFQLTAVGCGLAGYTPRDIAPMFAWVSPNIQVPEEFAPFVKGIRGPYGVKGR